MNVFHARSTVIDPKSVTQFWIGNVSHLYEPDNRLAAELDEEPSVFERSRMLRTAFEEEQFDPCKPFFKLVKSINCVAVCVLVFGERVSELLRFLWRQRRSPRALDLGGKGRYILHFR
jgi:hypothetical protein